MVADEPSYKRRLPAGIVDSSFASLATFAVGLAAVNLFDDVSRGVYAVYFTAFMLGGVLPRNLIFTPAEVRAVELDTEHRLGLLSQSLRLGLGPALLGATAALIAWAVTASYADPAVAAILTLTSAVTMVLSPMQDHVRKMLHIAAKSWRAAITSIVQFAVVALAVGLAIVADIDVAWIPFGALAVANAVSLTVARILSTHDAGSGAGVHMHLRELAAKGKWLVIHAAAPSITAFAVSAIVAELADPETLGYAEAARVVAQPVLVLAAGLTAVLAPRSMRAAMDTDRAVARNTSRAYLLMMFLAGAAYIAIAGWDWVLNPMAYIVPSAYVVSGLVVVTVIGNLVQSGVFLQVNELLGAYRERFLAGIAWAVTPVMLAIGATAGVTGAFARPLSRLAGATIRYGVQDRVLRNVYADAPPRIIPVEVIQESSETRSQYD